MIGPRRQWQASGTIEPITSHLYLCLKITWAIFIAVWVIGAFTSKRTVRRQSLASRVGMLGLAILGYWLLFSAASYLGLPYRRFLPDSAIFLWLGLLMTLVGVVLAIWARLTLGRNWSGTVTVKQNHQLIRTGPYAWVRHPIYTGITFALFGTAIFDGKIRGIILLVAILTVLVYKMKLEEQFMTEQFGSEYTSYRRGTKALLPFLW